MTPSNPSSPSPATAAPSSTSADGSVSQIIGFAVHFQTHIRSQSKSPPSFPPPQTQTTIKHQTTNHTSVPRFLLDIVQYGLQDLRLLSVGGNVGATNSYLGLSIETLTNGVYDIETLTTGNNLQCFIFQTLQSETPTLLKGLYADVSKASQQLLGEIKTILQGLECPQLQKYDTSEYAQFPGYVKAKGIKA